ncbi:hypothetical protein HIM_04683 [Hirsutella minnesotensis 3608]|uniref:Uncharacterized protein n=1 Tax=Hirsutella minnesotensis 3608 TaxID=1043627 RepID=A0A0F8A5S9_9HYPO|nr:hypothetical protein HIM_04683 [Hirsutella minnesotensis 3608]
MRTPPLHWLFGLCVAPLTPGSTACPRGEDAASLAQPLPPSQDPWYRAPLDFETRRPGELLKVRLAPGNLTEVVGSNTSAAYHLLYRTTDSRDRPSWAVTTLFLPRTMYFSPSGKASLMSYQFAYNSANLDSSPSIGLYWRLAQENRHLGIRSSTSLVHEMLSQGWLVNTPDYMGPDAAFGARTQAGHATLDSIRAVVHLAALTGQADFNVAIGGYSGGTIATLTAAQLQRAYAPELPIAGAVLGGLVDKIAGDFDSLNRSPIAGTLVAFLLGITAQYPDARRYLENQLVPATAKDFMSARDMNVADAVVKFAGKDIYQFFKGGASDLQAPILRELYYAQADLSDKGVPTMPLFVYKAIKDQYCPIEQTDATVKLFCDKGAVIKYERNSVGEHVSEIENGRLRARAWLWTIFNESFCDSSCTTVNVTVGEPLKLPSES